MHEVLHEQAEVSLRLVPVIVFIAKLEFFVVRVEEALALAVVLALLLELGLDLLPLVPADVYGVAPLAATILAPISGESGSTLEPRDLAEAGLACLRKGLHALPAAPVFHYEFGGLKPFIGVEVLLVIVVLVQVRFIGSTVVMLMVVTVVLVFLSVLGNTALALAQETSASVPLCVGGVSTEVGEVTQVLLLFSGGQWDYGCPLVLLLI